MGMFLLKMGTRCHNFPPPGLLYDNRQECFEDDEANQAAFVAHFQDQLAHYRRVAAINVVDQTGKEKVIADTFLKHVLQYNNPDLMYVAFDFHEYCRGMRFENVSILTENILDVIKEMRYCWVDQNGLICDQRGVFRVNCIDCLDRTNVVQSAIARLVLEVQCRKLGLLAPDEPLPPDIRLRYQQLWANTGDVISRQYAGTAALKGDYTRTGERRFAGLMKDGMNSANRYYINRVRDYYRQAMIDLVMGRPLPDNFAMLTNPKPEDSFEEENEEILVEKEENMKTLIDECKKMLIVEPEVCLGGWGLIDCDPVTGDPTQQDMDIILLLSQHAYYVANYDDETDQITSYQKVVLPDLKQIEIGSAPAIFKSKHICIRMFYECEGETRYFHTFRTTNTRLFNNIVITIKNEDEAKESLKAICESFVAASKLTDDKDLPVIETKLERKKSLPAPNVIDIASEAQLQLESGTSKISSRLRVASSRRAIKPTGRRALYPPKINMSNISKTFAGLKRIRLRPKMPFMPAVWYSKDNNEKINDSSETTRILKGDKVITEPFADVTDAGISVTVSSPKSLQPPVCIDDLNVSLDSDLSSDELSDLEDAGEDDLILESCGILATDSVQVLRSMEISLTKESSSELIDEGSQRSSSPNPDILPDSGGRRRPLMDRPQKWRSMSLDVREDKEMKRTRRKSPAKEVRKFDFENAKTNDNLKMSKESKTGANGTDLTLVQDNDNVNNHLQDVNFDPENEHSGDDYDDDDDDFVLASDETKSNENDPWVNVKINEKESQELAQDSNLMVPQSSMKVSHSEGSIAATYHAEVEDMNVDLDQLELDSLSHVSPLSRLRVKMSAIALPNMPSPQTKRRQAQRVAKHNRLKSKLRFQECQTKIILL